MGAETCQVGNFGPLLGTVDDPIGGALAHIEFSLNPRQEHAVRKALRIQSPILYSDADGVATEREIAPKAVWLHPRSVIILIDAFCHLREEDRTFRNDLILEAINVQSGEEITDLGKYLWPGD
ncbi:hypothetical protein [Brucella microti]|uniref:hypothetical protein n=1 Tax=Brucella microti TaxID=444163 RepID=UPI0005A13C0D|nr:hypothetical protein [Brucella microti]